MTRLTRLLLRPRDYLALARQSVAIERLGAYRIEHQTGRRRRLLSRWADPFAKEAALWPFVEELRRRGARGEVVLAMATSGAIVVRWPLAEGSGAEWPFEADGGDGKTALTPPRH